MFIFTEKLCFFPKIQIKYGTARIAYYIFKLKSVLFVLAKRSLLIVVLRPVQEVELRKHCA